MNRTLLSLLLVLVSLTLLGGCAEQKKQTETAIATLGGTTPEDAYRKYFDYMSSGAYKEAYGLLSTPSRQIYDRTAINLMQMRPKMGLVPDPQDRLYLEQLYAKLTGSTGEDLFVALMRMSEVPQGAAPVTLGALNQISETTAEALNSVGVKVDFLKEPDGLWRIDLPSAELEASLGALETRLNAIKSGVTPPAVLTTPPTETTTTVTKPATMPPVSEKPNPPKEKK